MKKLKCYLIGILLAGTLLSGCGKEKETNKGHYSPNQGENVVITTPENSPIVNINNIVAHNINNKITGFDIFNKIISFPLFFCA